MQGYHVGCDNGYINEMSEQRGESRRNIREIRFAEHEGQIVPIDGRIGTR
jgi:hypothetical protein